MKIGNPLDVYRSGAPSTGAASLDADKAKTSATASSSSSNETSATVKLSGGLDNLKAGLNADGAFDANRVEQIKAAFANGTFKVDSEVVADKVISSNIDALTRSNS